MSTNPPGVRLDPVLSKSLIPAAEEGSDESYLSDDETNAYRAHDEQFAWGGVVGHLDDRNQDGRILAAAASHLLGVSKDRVQGKCQKVRRKLEGSGGVVEREASGLVLVMIVGLPAKFFEAVAELLG